MIQAMKDLKPLPIADCRLPIKALSVGRRLAVGRVPNFPLIGNRQSAISNRHSSAFTLVEIAICLAIIGIALVGIIGVLPIGLNAQRDSREETIINQDVSVLMPIVTQGARGADDLTNYVYAITNVWTFYKADGTINGNGMNGYTANGVSVTGPYNNVPLTNGANIVGLLSTPEYIATNGVAAANLVNSGYSNHITAYIRSMSGLASEKPPQNNDIVVGDSFTYQVVVVNAPVAMDTNSVILNSSSFSSYNQQLWLNQREVRMLYRWPQLPNGKVGVFSQNFRTTVAGQLVQDPNNFYFYYYQPQSFGVNPN